MGREWKEVPDETEAIVLQDTQEYRVAGVDEEFIEDPEGELEEFDAVDDPEDAEVPEELEETEEFEDESEYEDDEFDDEYEETDEVEYDDDLYEDEDLDDFEETKEEKRPVVGDEPREPFGTRIKAVWAALAAQTRGVDLPRLPDNLPKLPDKPEIDPKLAAPVVAILLASLAVGFGAYAIGKGSGDDVDVARIEGEAAGRQAGAIEGATRGYAAGFVKGRDAGFQKAYVPAYKLNFKRAFEQAGLEVPADEDIDVPEP